MMKAEEQLDGVTTAESKCLTTIDEVLLAIKPFGRYQIWMTVLYVCVTFMMVVNMQFMGFGGAKPQFKCGDQNMPTQNGSLDATASGCWTYENCSPENLTMISVFRSIAVEWHLVCDRSYYLNLITSLQMGGVMCGALLGGPISDWYGRKITTLILSTFQMVVGACSAFSPSWQVFAAFRFFIGFFLGATMVTLWVFTAETTTNRYRFMARALANCLLAYFDLVLIAYITKSWKWLSLVGNLQGLPVLVLYFLFTFESPRWLLQMGRVAEAEAVMMKIAKVNGHHQTLIGRLKLAPVDQPNNGKSASSRFYVWDLFRHRTLAIWTLVCLMTWFVCAVANYGMFFGLTDLPGDLYINMTILACVNVLELPVAIYDSYNKKLNRKICLTGGLILVVMGNLGVSLVLDLMPEGTGYSAVITLISVLGQLGSSVAFDTAYLLIVELFPALMRSNAGAVCSVGARIGSIIAPQLLLLQKFWPELPYICFAVIAAIGAVVDVFFLPNTKRANLPESVQDSKKLSVTKQRY